MSEKFAARHSHRGLSLLDNPDNNMATSTHVDCFRLADPAGTATLRRAGKQITEPGVRSQLHGTRSTCDMRQTVL
jgi:hypothetical protein